MPFSSQKIGTWAITSMGDMSPAMMTSPWSPFFSALTTSLTPRRIIFALAAFFTVFSAFFASFLPARGGLVLLLGFILLAHSALRLLAAHRVRAGLLSCWVGLGWWGRRIN